jgi:NAD(P)-dependent dehydrogenase (short-subunit alcohol dehydrogenase family)
VRDPERAKALEVDGRSRGVELDIRFIDITDHAAVASVVDAVAQDYGHIDAVVSQAGGIFALGTAEQVSMAGFRATLETNFFGNLAVIRAVLPYLRASRGRLITMTSLNGVIAAPYNDAYAASKFALEGVMESIAPLVARFGVKGHNLRTRTGRHRCHGTAPPGAADRPAARPRQPVRGTVDLPRTRHNQHRRGATLRRGSAGRC